MNRLTNPIKSRLSHLVELIRRPYKTVRKGTLWYAHPETDYDCPLYNGCGEWIDRSITKYIEVGAVEVTAEIGVDSWHENHEFTIDEIVNNKSNQKIFKGTCIKAGLYGIVKNGDKAVFSSKDITRINISHYTNKDLLPHVVYVTTPYPLPSYSVTRL